MLLVLALSATVFHASAPSKTYIMDPLGHSARHPSSFAFAADGDLVARGLRWSHWGSSVTTASGTFIESPRPAGTRSVTMHGSVRASGLKRCANGRSYYTRFKFTLPASAPFKPTFGPFPDICSF